jgi:GTP diphosphokinase / guanosine-3',5'-bis(diphosphate) 3'-diphosphatase
MDQDRPPVYEMFFAPLQVIFDPNTHERVEFAYIASKFGHHKQVRDDGSRFFDHPKGAAWIYISELEGKDPEVIINILLHDIQEDSYLLSPYRIALNFGTERALDVRALTKLPKGKETTEEYLSRIIARGPRAIVAKLCDRLHNLRNVKRCTPEKRKRQVIETNEYHGPLLIPALHGYGSPWKEQAECLDTLLEQALEKLL